MEPLTVEVVHLYPKENAEVHHTSRFEEVNEENPRTTIVRRGAAFNGFVRFTRPVDEENDVVQLVFNLGDVPTMETQAVVTLRRDVISDDHAWSGKILCVQGGNDISFQISTPVFLPVGQWWLRVVTRTKNSQERQIFEYDQDLYILFNPWSPADQTYMKEEQLLQEYVLNDLGKVWVGSVKSVRGRPWTFGQFDARVLPAVMFMLDKANIPYQHRGDPVKMARIISQIVNSNDDDGVLVGRWDGQYDDGTSPYEWAGSVDILDQYLNTGTAVPYGQCWVFAGVVNTVCRALGLPSRVVTNMVSAHDANNTLSVDKYYSETMEEMSLDPNNPAGGVDSIWNYHVWNDVWMARPDLPIGYGGWQAIDATPQETSQGLFQCGPASLEAIKRGMIGFGYDVEFMLASVNADLMRWRRDPEADDGFSLVDTNKFHIGRAILTKKPFVFDPIGDSDRQNITDEYKNAEGTGSERMALYNGVQQSARAKRYYSLLKEMKADVTFTLQDIDSVFIGKPFRVAVDIFNNSNEERNIKATLSATTVFYNGVRADIVKKTEGNMRVGPQQREQISIQVSPEEYLPRLVEDSNFKISAMALVDETKYAWADDDDFQLTKPIIDIKFNEDLILGQPTTAVVAFMNPLDLPLTGCIFRVWSQGIEERKVQVDVADVKPHGLVTAQVTMQPKTAGKIYFVANFTSKELKDINGSSYTDVFEG